MRWVEFWAVALGRWMDPSATLRMTEVAQDDGGSSG